MSSTVEQIKDKLGIVDVVGGYIKLEKAGTNFKAKCPFHHEKTPSFFVSPTRGSYYCFGCSAKGDIFTFVEEFEGTDFLGALKVLADKAGVEIVREHPGSKNETTRLFEILEEATQFFEKNLDTNPKALAYLSERGVRPETMKEWRIGFAPDEWKALYSHLSKKNIKPHDMDKAGLVKQSEKSEGDFYDRFRSRIMFPIFDTSGRVVAFSGRIFGSDASQAKYINSPETPLFNKSKILYGFHKAKNGIRVHDYAILVEGQMDLIMSQQAGLRNTVASSGTALTPGHVEMIHRLTDRLIIAYDADNAGVAASERAWKVALEQGLDVKIAALPHGQDPADAIKENPESWKKALTNSTHVILYSLENILRQAPEERARGKLVREKIIPLIAVLESSIERSHFVSLVASQAGVPEKAVWEDLEKAVRDKNAETPEAKSEVTSRNTHEKKNAVERRLMGIVYYFEAKNREQGSVFTDRIIKTIGKENYSILQTTYGSIKDELLFEAELTYGSGPPGDGDMEELLANFKEDYIKQKFTHAMTELAKAEKNKDTEKIKTLLHQCKVLSEELRAISKKI